MIKLNDTLAQFQAGAIDKPAYIRTMFEEELYHPGSFCVCGDNEGCGIPVIRRRIVFARANTTTRCLARRAASRLAARCRRTAAELDEAHVTAQTLR